MVVGEENNLAMVVKVNGLVAERVTLEGVGGIIIIIMMMMSPPP